LFEVGILTHHEWSSLSSTFLNVYKQTLTVVLKLIVSNTTTVKKVSMCWVTEVLVPAVGRTCIFYTSSTSWLDPISALCNGFRWLFAMTKSSLIQADQIRVPCRDITSHSDLYRSALHITQKQAAFFVVTKN